MTHCQLQRTFGRAGAEEFAAGLRQHTTAGFRQGNGSGAKAIQLGQRGDGKVAVMVQMEHAGEAHGARPPGRAHGVFGALFLNPAPQDSTSLGIELGFRGIKGAQVQFPGLFRFELHSRWVEMTRLPEHLAQRGVDEDVAAIQGEEIRTLPHFAIVAGVRGFVVVPLPAGQWVEVFPRGRVLDVFRADTAGRSRRP